MPALRRLIAGGVVVGLSALAVLGSSCGKSDPLAQCIQHVNLKQHIHVQLILMVDGKSRSIPANVGITAGCMRPLHTHDPSGMIHIESPQPHTFTLGDFLAVWSGWQGADPLSGLQIQSVLVNGAPYQGAYEGIPLRDGGVILLEASSERTSTGSPDRLWPAAEPVRKLRC